MRDQGAAVVGTERLSDDRPPGSPGERCHLNGHGRIGQITKQHKGSGNRREALALTAGRLDPDPRVPVVTAIEALGPRAEGGQIGHQRLTERER